MGKYTEEELEKLDKKELVKILIQLGLREHLLPYMRKELLISTILESQEEARGS